MARIIGTDRQPMGRQYLQAAQGEVAKQGDIMQRGLEIAQQTSASLTESALRANEATANSLSTQAQIAAQQGQVTPNNVFAGISKALSTFDEFQKAQAAAAMERQKQLSETEAALASTELDQLGMYAQEIVYKENSKAYEDKVHEIISKYPNLSPSKVAELFNKGYGYLTEIEKKIASATLDNINKVRDSVREMETNRLMVRLSGVLSRMESPTADLQALWDEFDNQIKSALSENRLDEVQTAQMMATLYSEALKSHRVGVGAKQQIAQKLDNVQSFLSAANEAYTKYGNNPQAYRQAIYAAATANNIPFEAAKELSDPYFNERDALEHQELMSRIQQQQQEQYWESLDIRGVDTKYSAYLALSMLLDPVNAQRVKANVSPSLARGLDELVDIMKRAEKARLDYKVKVNAIRQQIEAFNAATAGIIAGRGQEDLSQATNMLTQFIQLNAQANPALASQLESMIQSAPQIQTGYTPEQRAEAAKQQMAWRERVVASMQEEARLEVEKLKMYEDALAPYGLNNVDFRNKATLERFRKEYEIERDKLAAEEKARREAIQSNPGFARPNFNTGDLTKFSKAKSPRTQKEVILPIAAEDQNRVRVGSPRGEDRGTHKHAGLDIASVDGSPLKIVSPVTGKVVRSLTPEQSGGYGYVIDIVDAYTGAVHRFAHLPTQARNVGDIVQVGEFISETGNTGRSSGNHLHWEVRKKSDFGFEGTYDPEIFMAANNVMVSTTSNQPRWDNSDLYVNAPNPYVNNPTQDHSMTMPARALVLNRLAYIIDNTFNPQSGSPIRLEDAFPVSNPIRPSADPGIRTNNNNGGGGGSTFGYAALARDTALANKMVDVAKRLNLNPQYLADVIAFESKFYPGRHRNGATGLIGFVPRGGGDRRAWIHGDNITVDQLAKLPAVQQMEYVYKYLKNPEFQNYGGIKSVYDLAAVIFGGYKLFEKWKTDPKAALQYSDGHVTFEGYIQKLGRDVNRRYQVPGVQAKLNKTAPIHTSFVQGCPICKSLISSGSQIVPHQQG